MRRLLAILALAFALSACTETGAFDGKGFSSAVGAVSGAYQTYDRTQNPGRYQPAPERYYPYPSPP